MAMLLLLSSALYGAEKGSNFYATGSDALVYTYLIGDGLHSHTIALPDQHTNLLKLPIFYLQSLFPYHYTSYMIMSILLMLIAIAAWSYLVIKLFGNKYRVIILTLLAAVLFTSVVLNLSIVETTVRNIEFPIALWFIFIIHKILKGEKQTPKELTVTIIACALYGLMLAGDNYFEYAISLPLVLVILWYWLQSRIFTRQMRNAILLVVVMGLLSVIFREVLSKTGMIITYKSGPALTIVTLHNLAPSITTALTQLLDMQGANIFGATIGLKTLSLFMDFGILAVGTAGLLIILARANRDFRKAVKLSQRNTFIFVSVAVSFFVTFLVYIFSGQVVNTLSNGQVVSLGQYRYIAFLPFLVLIGFIWVLKTYYDRHKLVLGLVVVSAIIVLLFSYAPIKSSYTAAVAATQPNRSMINSIVADLRQDNVKEVLTGYWYSSPIRFWSNNTIGSTPIISCNSPFFYNVREDWYRPQGDKITALVIDRPDPIYWNCTNNSITSIYGTPSKIQVISGTTPGSNAYIWVYNYDIRDHLTPFI
jgi:hypothetical protein